MISKHRNFHLSNRSVLFLILILSFVFTRCQKDRDQDLNSKDPKQVEKLILASEGGILITSDSVKLIIPPDALPANGKVFLGKTGNESTSVPNKNLEIIGEPITIHFPADSILKPVQLTFLRSAIPIDTISCTILLFNGSSYMPVGYSLSDLKVIVSIDKINCEQSNYKGALPTGEIIILIALIKQTPPQSQMGLNKVTLQSGKMYFSSPSTPPLSKILLLIHGWMGDATTWETILPRIINETNPGYEEFWTFVYNSSLSIKDNARSLADKLKGSVKGAQIDIVAHSMGGLVARSMIEQYGGSQYVNRLVTLGTPHEGSPLALFRSFFGMLAAFDGPIELYIYNYFTQGFRDLSEDSNFIAGMKTLSVPPVSYYTIASTNNPNAEPRDFFEIAFKAISSSEILSGADDGIVSVKSAKGVRGAIYSGSEVNIPVVLAHLDMPDNGSIYNQVLGFLRSGNPKSSTDPIPQNGATDVVISPLLKWSCIDSEGDPLKYDVYFGTSENSLIKVASDVTSTTISKNDLNPGTTYIWKIVAKDNHGNSTIGPKWRFTTTYPELPDAITDIEGNVYKTIKIGYQTWMKENLRVTKYNDNTYIPVIVNDANWAALSSPGYCWHQWNVANKNKYGALYNWYAVNTKKLCPNGWHVPDKTDWEILLNKIRSDGYLGLEGKALKSTAGWNPGNGVDVYGYSALPAGDKEIDFSFMSQSTRFWSSSPYWQIYIEWWQDGLNWYNLYDFNTKAANCSASIRCIKN